jgi:Flp pilus assembly protein TadB
MGLIFAVSVAGLGLCLLLGRNVGLRGAISWSLLRRPSVDSQRELVEAVAVFTELLRDSVVAAAGLEQAIQIVADVCPPRLEPHVRRLVARLQYGRIDDSLRQFASEIGHPSCDFVVAALLASVSHQTRDLGSLLTQLSESTREESRLYLRVWVSRARTRTAVRIVSVSLGVFVGGLMLMSPQYLSAYGSPVGAAVLAVVASGFSAGLILLDRMSRFAPQVRLVMDRESV